MALSLGKIVGSLAVVGALIAAVASCDDGYYRGRYRDRDHGGRCDYVETQCRTVCDYYCDYWSCYPSCWDQCWDECGYDPRPPTPPPSSSSSSSGATSSSSSSSGSTLPTDAGTGVLCTSCASNADCESGALCILRGGAPRDTDAGDAPAGRGFCGASCSTSADCPDGFLCSQLGSSRQCLPTGNACQ